MLSRTHFQAIEKLIKSGKQRVNNTKAWQVICEQENIGQLSGRFIEFTTKEIQILRKLIVESEGIDLQEQSLEGDRTAITKLVNNEKLSNEAPFASALLFATKHQDGIPCLDRCYECPPKGFIGLDIEDIDVKAINKLVVVENGRAFLDWHLFKFPSELDGAIFVYRGHGGNAKHVSLLFAALPESVFKVGFFDFDPAGIDMGNAGYFDAVLFPYFWKDTVAIKQQKVQILNKPSVIASQQKSLGDRYLSYKPAMRVAYEFIEKQNIAVTQEAIAFHRVPLDLVRL